MLIVIAACALSFLLFHWMASALSGGDRALYWTIWVLYYSLSHYLEVNNMTHMPSWRRSRFARFVGQTVMRTKFSKESLAILENLKITGGPYVLLCIPHGLACLHLVFGVAAHGGNLNRDVGDRTFVVAHWIYQVFPIIRNIYAAFGVVPSRPSSRIKKMLAKNYSVALVPGGLQDKLEALVQPEYGEEGNNDTGTIVRALRPEGVGGIFWLGANARARFVPIFSPHEGATYKRFGVGTLPAPLILTLGPFVILQRVCPLEWHVGQPIDSFMPQVTASEVVSLENKCYAALTALAKETDHRLVVTRK